MGVNATLYEITPAEVEAARADVEHAVRIVSIERTSSTGRGRCELGKTFGGLLHLYRRGGYDEEVTLLDYEAGRRTGVGDIVVLDPDVTSTICDQLQFEDVRMKHLAKFFDPSEMVGIYPDTWEDAGELDRLLARIPEMRVFFARAYEKRAGVLSVCG